MSETCALNKWWSDGISDLEELRSWDCGMELGSMERHKHATTSWCSLEIWTNVRELPSELFLCLTIFLGNFWSVIERHNEMSDKTKTVKNP